MELTYWVFEFGFIILAALIYVAGGMWLLNKWTGGDGKISGK